MYINGGNMGSLKEGYGCGVRIMCTSKNYLNISIAKYQLIKNFKLIYRPKFKQAFI